MISRNKPDSKIEPQYKINAQYSIIKDSYYYNQIELNENHIKANKFSYAFLNYVLKGTFKFSVQFQTEEELLAFGIADIENKSLPTLNDNYVILFNKGNFSAFGKFIKEFIKSKAGDILSVIGNTENGSVEFRVNNTRICSHIYEELTRDNIQFIPFIRLSERSEASIIELFPEVGLLGVFLSESFYLWDYDIIYEVHWLIKIEERNDGENMNE